MLDAYQQVKGNVEYVKRVKAAIERENEKLKEKEEAEKKKKEFQMNEFEIKK